MLKVGAERAREYRQGKWVSGSGARLHQHHGLAQRPRLYLSVASEPINFLPIQHIGYSPHGVGSRITLPGSLVLLNDPPPDTGSPSGHSPHPLYRRKATRS